MSDQIIEWINILYTCNLRWGKWHIIFILLKLESYSLNFYSEQSSYWLKDLHRSWQTWFIAQTISVSSLLKIFVHSLNSPLFLPLFQTRPWPICEIYESGSRHPAWTPSQLFPLASCQCSITRERVFSDEYCSFENETLP